MNKRGIGDEKRSHGERIVNVLVCGARGFLGTAICAALEQAGHRVVKGVRVARDADEIALDYRHDVTPDIWRARLAGIDAVVNAVGIIVERDRQRFEQIHRQAPIALFSACAAAGVRRVVQISAAGAQRGGSAYFDSKRAADAFLATLPLEWQIARPSLVYGAHGQSAGFFRMLASLPVYPLPAGGRQALQPVHVDDFAASIVALLDPDVPAGQCVELVGATRVTYREMLACYRSGMRLPPAWTVSVPGPVMRVAARVGDYLPGATLTRDTWKMLQAGNTGDVAGIQTLLQRPPAGIESFIPPQDAPALRQQAFSLWRPALLRAVLAIVWIWTAVVSALIYPVPDSLALLARVHLTGPLAVVALYGAALLDLGFGLASWWWPSRRLWLAQAALIAFYTVVIAIALPEFVTHPFGPLLKNLPILAILFLLLAEEKEA